MAYEKHTWECGETVTAELLNHMENGIEEASSGGGGSVYIVNASFGDDCDEQIVLDKTFTEIRSATLSGKNVLVLLEDDPDAFIWPVKAIYTQDVEYYVSTASSSFVSDAPDGILATLCDDPSDT